MTMTMKNHAVFFTVSVRLPIPVVVTPTSTEHYRAEQSHFDLSQINRVTEHTDCLQIFLAK